MKKCAAILIVISSILTGCVVAEPRSQYRGDRDRDGDGVRNSQDRYPDNPRRY
jgi:hypothetical protein